MRVRLEGDRVVASRWIAWAKTRMAVLRNVVTQCRLPFATKYYPLENGILISVRASSNTLLDEIVITAHVGDVIWITGEIKTFDGFGLPDRWLFERDYQRNGAMTMSRQFGSASEVYPHPGGYVGTWIIPGPDGLYVRETGSLTNYGIGIFVQWRLQKKKADGTLVWDMITPEYNAVITDLAFKGPYVFACGAVMTDSPHLYYWRFEKRNRETGGLLISHEYIPPGMLEGVASRMAVDDEGNMYIYGLVRTDPVFAIYMRRLEKRSAADGAFIWANPEGEWDVTKQYPAPRSIGYSDGHVFLGSHYLNYVGVAISSRILIEKRRTEDGTLVWSRVIFYDDAGFYKSYCSKLAVDHSGVYVAVLVVNANNGYEWHQRRLIKLDIESGSIVWDRSTDDMTVEDIDIVGPHSGQYTDITLGKDSVYLCAESPVNDRAVSYASPYRLVSERRSKDNGDLLWLHTRSDLISASPQGIALVNS